MQLWKLHAVPPALVRFGSHVRLQCVVLFVRVHKPACVHHNARHLRHGDSLFPDGFWCIISKFCARQHTRKKTTYTRTRSTNYSVCIFMFYAFQYSVGRVVVKASVWSGRNKHSACDRIGHHGGIVIVLVLCSHESQHHEER